MLREHLRERNRPEWAALFRRQREEWKELNSWQKSAYLRLRYSLRHRGQGVAVGKEAGLKGTVQEALKAVFGRDNPHGVLSRKHRAERRALASDLGQQRRAAMRHVNKRYRRELGYLDREREQLRTQQLEQTRALTEKHSRESQERARAIKEGRDVREVRRETGPAMRDEFERRAWEKIREAKKRNEDERKRGKDRDGGRER
jgi:hypothetical protein